MTPARAGLGRFATVLALPGVRPVLVAAFVGRLPIGMMSLSIVLLVSEETGSYATAGAVAATQALAGGDRVAAARPADRPDRADTGAGRLRRRVPAVRRGADRGRVDGRRPAAADRRARSRSAPPTRRCSQRVRALLTQMAGSEDLAATAFAFEAIVQEAFFIAGPLLVALLVAVASPQAALVFVAVVTSGGTLAFAATRASRSWRPGAAHERLIGALASPGVRTLLVVSAAFGLAFGTLEVTMPAFADERGSAATGGVLLAALAVGQHARRRLVRVARVHRPPLHADDLLLRACSRPR